MSKEKKLKRKLKQKEGKIVTSKITELSAIMKKSSELLEDFLDHAINARDSSGIKLALKLSETEKLTNYNKLHNSLISLVRYDQNFDLINTIFANIEKSNFSLLQDITNNQENLLIIASLYGAKKNVALLIKYEFDSNFIDEYKCNSLHIATMHGYSDIVKLLVEYNPGLIKKPTDIYYPIHLAYLYNRQNIVDYLIKKSPTTKSLKISYFKKQVNFTEFKELCDKGGFNPVPLNTIPGYTKAPTSSFSSGITNYYKLILSNNEDKLSLSKEITKTFTSMITEMSDKEKDKSELFKKDARGILEILINIFSIIKNDENDNIEEFIIKNAIYFDQIQLLYLFYNNLTIENFEQHNDNKALIYAKKAYSIYKKYLALLGLENGAKSLFNLANILLDIDPMASLKLFNEYLLIYPSNQEVIHQIANFYMSFEELNLFKTYCDKLESKELKALLQANYIEMNPNSKDLFNEEEITNVINQFSLNIDQPNFINKVPLAVQKEYDLYLLHQRLRTNTITDDYIKTLPNLKDLCVILQFYYHNKLWSEGYGVIKSFYSKKHLTIQNHNIVILKCIEFVFYLENDDQVKMISHLNDLEKTSSLGPFAMRKYHEANLLFAYDAIEKGDFEVAINHFKKCNVSLVSLNLLKHLSNNIKKPFIASHQISKIDEESSILIKEKNNETNEENIDKEDGFNDEENFNILDAKAIHEYFQSKKRKILDKNLSKDTSSEEKYSWVYQGNTFSTEDDTVVHLYDNYYATIDPKTFNNLDLKYQIQFETALAKGKADRNIGKNGVKIFRSEASDSENDNIILAELKINKGDRLYTTCMYKNPQGKYIFNFDKKGRHEEVKKATREASFKIIECNEFKPKNGDTLSSNQIQTFSADENNYNLEEQEVSLAGNE